MESWMRGGGAAVMASCGEETPVNGGKTPERDREIMIQERLERGKGAWAHREVMGVLGRAKG
jgi:hypothetical protein